MPITDKDMQLAKLAKVFTRTPDVGNIYAWCLHQDTLYVVYYIYTEGKKGVDVVFYEAGTFDANTFSRLSVESIKLAVRYVRDVTGDLENFISVNEAITRITADVELIPTRLQPGTISEGWL